MTEFILFVVIYVNSAAGPIQSIPMGEYETKGICETYAAQVKKDFAEPTKTIRATCLPKSAFSKMAGPPPVLPTAPQKAK